VGETTNCKWTKPSETDWHMALVEEPGQVEKLAVCYSVVVETARGASRARNASLTARAAR